MALRSGHRIPSSRVLCLASALVGWLTDGAASVLVDIGVHGLRLFCVAHKCSLPCSCWQDDDLGLEGLLALADDCGERLRAEADNNGDGVVDFNEYMAWWSKLPDKKRGEGGGGSGGSRYRG